MLQSPSNSESCGAHRRSETVDVGPMGGRGHGHGTDDLAARRHDRRRRADQPDGALLPVEGDAARRDAVQLGAQHPRHGDRVWRARREASANDLFEELGRAVGQQNLADAGAVQRVPTSDARRGGGLKPSCGFSPSTPRLELARLPFSIRIVA